MKFLERYFGTESDKMLKSLQPIVDQINALESDISPLSDEELKAKTGEFRDRVNKGETLDDILPEAFAVVREAAKRTVGMRPFDVQLMGGIFLHRKTVAEMRTGEGKTLVATLPVYLNALMGKGAHVVTVNDYLSRRDAVWMGQVYNFLGLTTAVINSHASYIYDEEHKTFDKEESEGESENKEDVDELDQERDETGSFHVIPEFLRPVERPEAYAADITYGTNSEFGFDYLRDNIEYDKNKLRQRGHNFAIIDEVDSILIDEARTPLIISAPAAGAEKLYVTFADIAKKLEQDEHYTIDEKLKAVQLTDKGITKAEEMLGIDNLYTEHGVKYVHHLETAVRAKAHYKKDTDYVVKNNEVIIVDSFTGRLQPGRRWSEGLHQAIEAKEGVDVQKESRTFASITYQNFFRMYDKLSGMTGTAVTSKEEFYTVYGLDTIEVPTNKPITRIDRSDLIFRTEHGKFTAATRKVKEQNEKGRPVLIGTASIEKNELFSEYLTRAGVPHELLNAKNHAREGEIIAQAGRKGGVTIATNMAGRGVDIKLGGNPGSEEEYEEVKALGGLFVLGTERHEARRIDNQLRGRSGRQGDPGETQFFVSLEDPLMRVFAADTVGKMMTRLGIEEDQPIENKMITRSLETAQTKIEGFHFDSRKNVLQYDNVINTQRSTVYERRNKIMVGSDEEVEEYINDIMDEYAPDKKDDLKKKKEELGDEYVPTLRRLALQTNDMFWVDHLEMMDHMRSSVNLRAYGQRDPLVEYKREGLEMFKNMEEEVKKEIAKIAPNLQSGALTEEQKEAEELRKKAKFIADGADSKADAGAPAQSAPKKQKVGRNDPCPCGSGKKYKKCHGA